MRDRVSGEGWDAKTQNSVFREGKLCYRIKKFSPLNIILVISGINIFLHR
jgi:hypothetical protein